jgi:uncharacterized NAD-dependent epimerase/dehydratase family protein
MDNAKTCHGLLRGTERFKVLGVIDRISAGKDAGEVMDGRTKNIPVFATVQEALDHISEPIDCAIVGVALHGGHLPDDFKNVIKTAIQKQLSIVCGLHTLMSEDEELVALARLYNVTLHDIRKPRPTKDLAFWSGDIYSVKTPKIAVLGTDCAVGKRTTCRFLMQMCQANGINAEMIYTGQTGWLQGYRHGFIFDSTLNDFVSGELERVIVECDRETKPDLILLEGQSALRNPSGPCGSELLLSANIKKVVLQHQPTRAYFDGVEEFEQAIPPIADEIALIKMYGAEVIAVTLNETNADEEYITKQQKDLQASLGIPVIRPLKDGLDVLLPIIKEILA